MAIDLQPASAAAPRDLRADDLRRLDARTNAFLEVFDDPVGTPSGPLSGQTFGVKEVIDQRGRRTPWGVDFLLDRVPTASASAVDRIAAAGALCRGTTRSTVLAIAGDSGACNPHDAARSPGGSSAGSAAGVAAGLVDFALGTQTVGSIIRPASYCGVVGFKPSFDALPLDGVMPLSAELDHLGFLTKDVATATKLHALFQSAESVPSVKEIAVPALWFTGAVAEGALQAVDRAAGCLRQLGFSIRSINLPRQVTDAEEVVLTGLLAKGIHDNHGGFVEENAGRLPGSLVDLARRGRKLSAGAVDELIARRDDMRASMLDAIGPEELLLMPSVIDLPPLLGDGTGRRDPQRLWSLLGWPALSLPVGQLADDTARLPLGVQLIGKPGSDFGVLELAAALERHEL